MGSCLSTPVDFEGEVNLYHFDLHRVVGKGAFGKVSISTSSLGPPGFPHLYPDFRASVKPQGTELSVFGCLCLSILGMRFLGCSLFRRPAFTAGVQCSVRIS